MQKVKNDTKNCSLLVLDVAGFEEYLWKVFLQEKTFLTIPLTFANFFADSAHAKNTADKDSRYKNLALSSKQSQCMKVRSKVYYCCK